MTVSTATIAQPEDETYGWDNLSPTAGTWRNIQWPEIVDTWVVWGKQVGKFTFDFELVTFKFTNLSPTIPAGAKILSAKLRGTAAQSSTTSDFFSVVRILEKDGLWDPVSTGPQWRSASAPASAFGPAFNFDADVAVLNIFASTLVDTSTAVTHTWPIRNNIADRYLRAGQGVDIVTGGTLGFVDLTIDRTGAVGIGNIWAEVYSQDGAGLADTLLATSNTRLASTAPVTTAPFRFTFSGPEQIILTAGQKIVCVLNGDYPQLATQHIALGWSAGGYAPGTFQIYGEGGGYDDQNYPMQKSFQAIQPGNFIVWIAPTFFLGVDYDTPDLSVMLQAHINAPAYSEGDPLAFRIERNLLFFPSGTADRRWANLAHPTLSPVRLIVEWRDRAIRVF